MGILDDFMKTNGIQKEDAQQEVKKETKPAKKEVKKAVKKPAKKEVKKAVKKVKVEKKEVKSGEAKMGIKVVPKESKSMVNKNEISGETLAAIYMQSNDVPGIGLSEINQILNWVNIKYLRIETEDPNNIGKVVYGTDESKEVLSEAVMPLFWHVHRQLTPEDDFKKTLCMSADCKVGFNKQKCVECPNKEACKIISSLYCIGETGTIYCASFRAGFGTSNLSKINGFGKQWLKMGSEQKKYKDFKAFYVFDAEVIPSDVEIPKETIDEAFNEIAKKINSHTAQVMATWE